MSRPKTIVRRSKKSPEVFGKRELPAAQAAFFKKVIPLIVDAENLKRERRGLTEKLHVQIALSRALRNLFRSVATPSPKLR
jgi:hypothetical protein